MNSKLDENMPLAEQLRPKILEEVLGQPQLTELPKSQLESGSFIFWGPPGSGKTTIARILGEISGQEFVRLSAVLDGIADIRKIYQRAETAKLNAKSILVFIDEIHRFNKAQQDALLPAIEDGSIRLIGATTENPSFALNSALLSRTQVIVLSSLDNKSLHILSERAIDFLGRSLVLDEETRNLLVALSDGDGRYLLNMIQALYSHKNKKNWTIEEARLYLSKRSLNYDKKGDHHFNLISALHKSLRASDCDAALYWLARMVLAGEDPHYLLRRLVRFAAEDIGLADPQALPFAISVWQSFERLGSPEGELHIAELVIFLATSPKSNSVYTAWKAAQDAASNTGSHSPPKSLLNAPTSLMKQLGYANNYKYDHDSEDAFSGQNCFPDDLPRERFYQPNERGFEREISKRVAYWNRLRSQNNLD
ncbi:replication-associated recombination protein A [Alphaproteobacteria bacterium]|nr:replication-associated recombination protein A [Alphaproteobacteria bacterium]